jgi:hypothetical protein
VKPARPPLAPPVRVGTEFEQDLHDRKIVGVRDNRRGIEAENRIVDSCAQFGVLPEQTAQRTRIPSAKCIVHALDDGGSILRLRLDVFLERRPAGEAVFPREDELRVGECDALLVR